jgi:hypothetical protein
MTVAAIVPRNDYTGTGSVDTYAYGFKILDQDDLLVVVADTDGLEETLTIGVDYTVTGVGLANGGNVVLTSDLTLNYHLTILQNVAIEQETSIRNDSEYYASIHEDTFDTSRRIDQQVAEMLQRAILFKKTSTTTGIFISDIVAESVLMSNVAGDEVDWEPRASFVGPTGPQGATGDPGEASVWFVGTGVPSVLVGVDDDMYLDDANGDVYQKQVGAWVLVANIAGPTGATGPTGFGTKNASTMSPAGTTQTVNWNLGEIQVLDLGSASGDVTLTFTNVSVAVARYTLFIIQGGTPRNVIWPASVKFPQAQAPIISTVDNAVDKVEMLWDTVNYYGDWNNSYA